MGARIDLTGQTFGRWTVLRPGKSKGKNSKWLCRCSCGVERDVLTPALRNGSSLSCGCYCREVNAAAPNGVTHGMRQTAEYSVFSGIKRRCNNKNDASYHRYGGAGVRCRFKGFEHFYEEVGPRPGAEYQIDRINSEGDYEPGNVRWVTPTQQQRNRKDSLYYELNGEKKHLKELCEDAGQPYPRVWLRLKRYGWSIEDALSLGPCQ